jgi:uncharacterized protein (TIGR03067 family)
VIAFPRLLVAALVCATASAAPVPKAVKKGHGESIVGEWREMKHDAAGEPTAEATGYVWRLEADGTAAVVWPDGTVVPAAYKLFDDQTPKRYDWTLTQHTVQFAGVYEVRGDTLRTAVVSADRERPTAVQPLPRVEYRTYVRAKQN